VSSARVVDVRYAGYRGELRGRASAVLSLARFGGLTALGARRGARAKLVPIFLIAVAFIPTIVVLGLRALGGPELAARLPNLIPYPQEFTEIGLDIALFAAIVTPELLCPDRRERVLSLYLSTAVTRVEYVGGKLLGAIGPLSLVALLPPLALFVGNVVFADHSLGYLQAHWGDAFRILLAGSMISLYFSCLGLAIASLTGRRAVAMGAFVGLLVLSGFTAGFLTNALGFTRYASLLALGRVPIVAARGLFGDDTSRANGVPLVWWYLVTAAVILVSLGVLAWRYRKGEG
jgi:ABC-2 type transport system permease protein